MLVNNVVIYHAQAACVRRGMFNITVRAYIIERRFFFFFFFEI